MDTFLYVNLLLRDPAWLERKTLPAGVLPNVFKLRAEQLRISNLRGRAGALPDGLSEIRFVGDKSGGDEFTVGTIRFKAHPDNKSVQYFEYAVMSEAGIPFRKSVFKEVSRLETKPKANFFDAVSNLPDVRIAVHDARRATGLPSRYVLEEPRDDVPFLTTGGPTLDRLRSEGVTAAQRLRQYRNRKGLTLALMALSTCLWIAAYKHVDGVRRKETEPHKT